MKILVMSLLRIGDVVLSAPVLKGLREQHPEAEIHLLINSQFKQVANLIPAIDRTIIFERDLIQQGLGDAQAPLFHSYEKAQSLVESLESEGYDWVINLTHSRLSGWLMSLIPAKMKTGLCFDPSGRASFGSSWFRFLNYQVESEGVETFHFTDIFKFGLGLGNDHRLGLSKVPILSETEKGIAEAETLIASLGQGPLVAIQPLTSDIKKNWNLKKLSASLEIFARFNSQVTMVVLAAPFEREALKPFVEILQQKGISIHLGVLSFEGAFSFLKRAKLLITGDTSIKHLAAAAKTPIVEISLGSSDVFRTGSYLHGSVILQSREACAPCVHSKACHKSTHACSDRISPDVVAMVANEVFNGRSFQLKTIAEEYKEEVEILRVDTATAGFWSAHSVLEQFSERSIARWIDLSCRKVWLDSADQVRNRRQGATRISERGTDIRRLSEYIRKLHPSISNIEWKHLLADLERQVSYVEGRLNGFKIGVEHLKGSFENPTRMNVFVRMLIQFRDKIRHSPILGSFKQSMDQIIEDDISPPFVRFRRIVDAVNEVERRTHIHLQLIRGLASEMEEERHEAQP